MLSLQRLTGWHGLVCVGVFSGFVGIYLGLILERKILTPAPILSLECNTIAFERVATEITAGSQGKAISTPRSFIIPSELRNNGVVGIYLEDGLLANKESRVLLFTFETDVVEPNHVIVFVSTGYLDVERWIRKYGKKIYRFEKLRGHWYYVSF